MLLLATVIIAWSVFDAALWVKIAGGIIFLASFIVSLGIIYSKAFSPWVAKPLAKALRRELGEEVRGIILEPRTLALFRETIEETFSHEAATLFEYLERIEGNVSTDRTDFIARLDRIEENQRRYMQNGAGNDNGKAIPTTRRKGARETGG